MTASLKRSPHRQQGNIKLSTMVWSCNIFYFVSSRRLNQIILLVGVLMFKIVEENILYQMAFKRMFRLLGPSTADYYELDFLLVVIILT